MLKQQRIDNSSGDATMAIVILWIATVTITPVRKIEIVIDYK